MCENIYKVFFLSFYMFLTFLTKSFCFLFFRKEGEKNIVQTTIWLPGTI